MNKEEIEKNILYLDEELYSKQDIYNLKEYTKKLQQENQKYKEVIDKAINDLDIIIDIVREKPLGSDCWIIDRLEGNKSILKEVK